MNDTPRTDALWDPENYPLMIQHARTLERELANTQRRKALVIANRCEIAAYAEALTAKAKALADALKPQEPLFAAYGMGAVIAYSELRKALARHQFATGQRPDEIDREFARLIDDDPAPSDGASVIREQQNTPEIAKAKHLLELQATELPNWARQLLDYITGLEHKLAARSLPVARSVRCRDACQLAVEVVRDGMQNPAAE